MKWTPLLILIALLPGCRPAQFIAAGEKDGVAVEYRWNLPPGKPPELLLKIANNGPAAQHVHLGLDLYYRDFTVEQFTADTCISAGRVLNGKLNGIYFLPRQVTSEQAASPDTRVDLTEFTTERTGPCP